MSDSLLGVNLTATHSHSVFMHSGLCEISLTPISTPPCFSSMVMYWSVGSICRNRVEKVLCQGYHLLTTSQIDI